MKGSVSKKDNVFVEKLSFQRSYIAVQCCTYHRILCPQFSVKTYTRVRNIHMALSLRKGSVFKEKPVVGQSCFSFVVVPRFDRLLSNCPVYFPVKGETRSTTILFAASAGKQY